MLRPASILFVLLIAISAAASSRAHADEGCVDFKWDVTQERALFAQTPAPLAAGRSVDAAPSAVPGRLYSVQLTKQDGVKFAAVPGKKIPLSDSYAGVLRLKVPAPGDYRVAIDLPLWIDVVSNGVLLEPKDFQGQHACAAPHKIVEFELPVSQSLVLQLSNAAADRVLVTLTRAPQRKL